MKQVVQNLSNGKTSLIDVPCPQNISGNVLIESKVTLLSAGTEKMLVDFGKANALNKARQQPDKVKMVLNKVKTDGLLPTIDAVRSKLDQPLPLGYCNAGLILDSKVDGFLPGDRVVSNGSHAEVVRIPKNLFVKIPDNVDNETASFTVLASIGLQGIRLAEPTLGETIVVSGLGLIGIMTVQMLQANGCRVLGIDSDSSRCSIARKFGIQTVDLSKKEDPISVSHIFSKGVGVDAVIITASSKSNDVVHLAAEMCRKRGRIVLVGVVGLNLRRDDFYKKEISFQVSASYGPGRYDSQYEEKGNDYPIGFIRWTERRNFEAVLDLMSKGLIDIKPLISHRYKIYDAEEAYEKLNNSSTLGILLEYPSQEESSLRSSVIKIRQNEKEIYSKLNPVVGFIGAGNYSSRTLIPAFKKAGVNLDTLVTSKGLSGVHHGVKSGFKVAATDVNEVFQSDNINTVAIVTRHNNHASQVISALNSIKNVFVEKPLALNLIELKAISEAYYEANKVRPVKLMIGFNRRFAPHIVKMRSLIKNKKEPKIIIITINAGHIPADHWTQELNIGGGRIIGEGCHFIDLMRFLVGSSIKSHQTMMIGNAPGIEVSSDKVSINLSFADGSMGTVHYLSNGGNLFPKERIEIFCGDAVLQMDNYRILKGYGWSGFKNMKLFKQNKGNEACVNEFIRSVRNGTPAPIPFEEIIESSQISIEVADSLKKV